MFLPGYFFVVIPRSCTWRRLSFNFKQPFWVPLCFIPWYSTRQIPEETKGCSPEVQSSELSVHPPHCSKDLLGYLQPRLLLNVTSFPSLPLLVKTSSSTASLLDGERGCHQCIPGASWISCAMLCCQSTTYWGGCICLLVLILKFIVPQACA